MAASHPSLEPLAEYLNNECADFLQHEAMFFEVGKESGALMGAFIWNTVRGQAAGGIRLRPYENVADYVCDGLRLATGMGRKNAMTGLWWGGGKGVVVQPDGCDFQRPEYRKELFTEYGDFLSSLRGCYIAAEDSGVCVDDIDVVFSRSRYTTCISPELGGSGNPSVPTAAGVVCAMEGALHVLGDGDLKGKTVAIQGCGTVARPLMRFLLEKGVKSIVAADIDQEPGLSNAALAREEFAGQPVDIYTVPMGDNSVLFEDCDIVSPCAWGGVLTDETVSKIKGKIVCGAANSQLADPASDHGMQAANITYVPDFVANPMGIVNCADESSGRVGQLGTVEDPALASRLGREFDHSVFNCTVRVLENAKKEGKTTPEAANSLADSYLTPHPIFGHRSKEIVAALMKDDWANSA
jgi:leucine dehydrogenase